ncbi:hypothetical protein GCM10022200_15670 [Microbacterium awajiense]|uniref:Glycosyltransferase n=1 Tax=Microbacterium awajiense TaxID=415214 RepID=A0ABP7AJD1_9MICO
MTAATVARDVVFTFSYETYADAVARGMMRPPDRILQTLMSSDEVGGLLVANPFRSLPGVAARRLSGRRAAALPPTPQQRLVTPVRLRRADPVGVPAIVRSYRRYDRWLRESASELGLVSPAVVTANPLVAAYCPFAWASAVTYFARDDWLSYAGRREYWPAYAAAYDQISEAEIGVAAVSAQIIERIRPRGPHVVVPNAIDPAEWAGPTPPAPTWLERIPQPRAIYVGTIDDRVDVEGLAVLASARPDLHIVLLGPAPEIGYVAALGAHPNVHVHPGVGRAEVVAALRNCQLSLLAHRRTDLTEAMSPLKVYEYLAAGLPVVSVDLPPVHGISERVLFVESTADTARRVDEALALGSASESERTAFLAENSWEARHRAVVDLVLRPPVLHRSEEFAHVV